VCSATSTTGRADRVDGGYRVSGRWPFVSGCHNAAYFAGLVVVHENGEPAPGRPPGWALVPRSDFEIIDTWNVAGLRGSGSHDVRVDAVRIPENALGTGAWSSESGGERLPDVLRIPLGVRLAYNKTGVGFGIARAAIDVFVDLAKGKTPFAASSKLRERPLAQRAVARAEARLRSARALVRVLAEELWQAVVAGRSFSREERAIFHIACADAAQACAEAVDLVAEAAGTSANRLDCPLERYARDVRVIRQHVTVAPNLIEDAGRVLLGLEPESVMLKLMG
jgi:alkylation response protein AidB-like acyl-CoA dehydrogenase